MNAYTMAKTAYSASATPVRTPRSTEYQTFARVTQKLTQADGKTGAEFLDLVRAIHENRQLWTLLATDVAGDGNALPQQLRAQLFYLAEFTAEHSRKVLKNEASVEALVDINTAIMRGLRTRTDLA
ncbi:flagellar biosynthesis regulator FlaF [Pseudohalocynthiibacter aestuariivivens]|nr:flagellar biosynthesis regulator FlaF [Pseudohalocynthiibacter aestuariivivens]MCK0102928.1 flagellar biosynthesis regulator FlaF [Pseudohalocynthiibacter sp. F2068]